MSGWNYAEIWEAVAEQIPEAPAQVQGERTVTWREFDQRANGVAHHLLQAGVAEQDKVAQYLYNCPEYLESVFAAWKAGLVPVNTNYRYTDDELVYLWDNADAVAVVFHGAFSDNIERIRHRLPLVRTWGRSGDHLYMLYTGGTTGMPKGVMWRQDDNIRNLLAIGVNPRYREDPVDYDVVREMVTGPGMVGMPACPLMHGTGCMTQLIVLSGGGCVVTLEGRTLDIEEMFSTIERRKVNSTAIVGDAFAKPMLRALEAEPDRWDLSSLFLIASSGVMFSEASKQHLIGQLPHVLIVDAFSSSEAIGMGQSISSAGVDSGTAKFKGGEFTKVFTEDLREVEPGSGEIGRVAVGGFQPIGYYKDPEKTAATFLEVDGKRYSVPGDFATVEADGSITLLGRGSVCINTGGEKVFPVEVEEVLKMHEVVADAVVVGVPDEKFGEAITAVIQLEPGASLDEAGLIDHVKGRLASYKAPKRVLPIATIGRAPNGKVDYKRLRGYAIDALTEAG